MTKYRLKKTKTEESIVNAYKRMEESVVKGYQAIEDTVVGAYQKIEDKFVGAFLEEVKDEEKEASPCPSQGGVTRKPTDHHLLTTKN